MVEGLILLAVILVPALVIGWKVGASMLHQETPREQVQRRLRIEQDSAGVDSGDFGGG